MKHTKGPWFIKLHSKSVVRQEGVQHTLKIDEHYDNSIGPLHVVDRSDYLVAAVASRDEGTTSEQAANALLIAHAPDLLELSSKLVGALRGEVKYDQELAELETIISLLTPR